MQNIAVAISALLPRLPGGRLRLLLAKAVLFMARSTPVRSAHGVMLKADWRDNSCLFSILGEHKEVAEAVESLRPGMCFIDIGANAGLFSIMAAKLVGSQGTVIAFEPAPDVYNTLVENIHTNSATVTTVMAAVGPESGPVGFTAPNPWHTGLSHLSKDGGTVVRQVGPAEFNTLVAPLIEGREVAVKVDVEGAEVVVIQALSDRLLGLPSVKLVIVEIDDRYLTRFGHSRHDVYDLLETVGFTPKFGRTHAKPHYDETFRR